MKKIIFTSMMLGIATFAQAQDTYFNDQLTNNAGDVYGSARFVGMGGAMGALGADISTISWNPAGLGLMRKNDVSLTFGAIWDKDGVAGLPKAHGTLDQLGGVMSLNLDDDNVPYVNFAFNYNKKKNFNNAFALQNNNLGGLSQMTGLADMAVNGYDTDNNLAGVAVDNKFLDKDDNGNFYNRYAGSGYAYTQKTWGSLNALDFNISTNIKDRFYLGFTLGVETMNYNGQTDYYESSKAVDNGASGDYSVYNDQQVDGTGINFKFGAIVRPFEYNALRIALAIETPTWSQYKSSTYCTLTDWVDNKAYTPYYPETYLEYAVRTPWKIRLGVGSTIDRYFAWDVDYEYANYSATKMGYPDSGIDDYRGSLFNNTWDVDMNVQTENNLKATHNVRAGIEIKPVDNLAFRVGYNFATSAYKENASFDQLNLNSYAMDYSTKTSYLTLGAFNSVTLGMGYRWKKAYLDVAYKLSSQKGDFYAFYEPANTTVAHCPNLLKPVNVDFVKHQLTATLGVRF
ncbi:MAG: hypothetical protein MJZ60_00640 [Bacteroidaceae bacterium]|nr:hypothetical protein [Bacteroidaceae bacterium]